MKAVCFGIVGLGRLGRRHAENPAWRVPGAQLVAACSPVSKEREWASSYWPELSFYAKSVDAVWLVTPTSLHATQIIAALRVGKHVFCEKPLSLDLAECDAVLEEHACHPHLQVMIGLVQRFDVSYGDAFERIETNAIGKSFMVRSQTCDKNDPDGFFVRFAPTSGSLFPRLQRARYRSRALAARQSATEAGVCERHDRDSRRLARVQRHRQWSGVVEFEGGQLAVFLCIAHDAARTRHADRGDRHGRDAVGEAQSARESRRDRGRARHVQRVHADVFRAFRGCVSAGSPGVRGIAARRQADWTHAERCAGSYPHRHRDAAGV